MREVEQAAFLYLCDTLYKVTNCILSFQCNKHVAWTSIASCSLHFWMLNSVHAFWIMLPQLWVVIQLPEWTIYFLGMEFDIFTPLLFKLLNLNHFLYLCDCHSLSLPITLGVSYKSSWYNHIRVEDWKAICTYFFRMNAQCFTFTPNVAMLLFPETYSLLFLQFIGGSSVITGLIDT